MAIVLFMNKKESGYAEAYRIPVNAITIALDV